MRVPLGPFQELFREQERTGTITAGELATRLGWTRVVDGRTISDASKVLRYLGLRGVQDSRTGKMTFRRSVNYTTGVRLCRAFGVDPVDVGV